MTDDESKPLISVVVPVYNKGLYLPDSLRSFDSQTYEKVEWVIVDDGSTDNSGSICRSWKPANGIVRVLSKRNGGASSARNEGLRHSHGEFVLFWDADDAQEPEMVEKMVNAAIKEKADVVVSAIRRVEQDGYVHDSFASERHVADAVQALVEWFQGRVSTGPCTKLVRRSLLLDESILFEEGVINEDVMWTAEVFGAARRIVLLGEPLYRYIARPGSVTAVADMRLLDVFDNCNKLEKFIDSSYPGIRTICHDYCAKACWSVILVAARGDAQKQFPELYSRSMVEFAKRKIAIKRCCKSLKSKIQIILVRFGLYGALKR